MSSTADRLPSSRLPATFPPTGLLEVATIAKPHGLTGEVTVIVVTNRAERFTAGTVLQSPGGPLEIVESRPHSDRLLVRFAGISTRERAAELINTPLWAEPLDDPDELWVHQLVGAQVIDRSGKPRGCVVSVVANPAADLLELETGALVPLNFVVELADGVVKLDEPSGLFDL